MFNERKSIGSILKELRKLKGLTQAQAAEGTGLNISVYNKIENDNKSVDVKELRDLAVFFEVKADYILGEEEEEPIMHYITKYQGDLSIETQDELKKVLQMIDDAEEQFELWRR